MFLKNSRKNKVLMQKIAHLLAGFVILINAYDRYTTGNPNYLLYLFAGLVFITVAILLPFINKKVPWVSVVFFLIESSLSFVIAFEYFIAGKSALPYAYLVVGLVQLIIPLIKSRKKASNEKLG